MDWWGGVSEVVEVGEDAGEWLAFAEGGVVCADLGVEFGGGEGEGCAGDETLFALSGRG